MRYYQWLIEKIRKRRTVSQTDQANQGNLKELHRT
jgi:hypothetical protein